MISLFSPGKVVISILLCLVLYVVGFDWFTNLVETIIGINLGHVETVDQLRSLDESTWMMLLLGLGVTMIIVGHFYPLISSTFTKQDRIAAVKSSLWWGLVLTAVVLYKIYW